jgi:hypothetical protein
VRVKKGLFLCVALALTVFSFSSCVVRQKRVMLPTGAEPANDEERIKKFDMQDQVESAHDAQQKMIEQKQREE